MKRQRITNLLWIFGIFLLLAAFFSSETYVWYWVKGKPPAFWSAFRFNMARWYPWAFLTPLIVRAVRRYPWQGRRWPVAVMAHLGLNGVCAALVALVYGGTKAGWSGLIRDLSPVWTSSFINLLHYNILAYWLIAVITFLSDKLRFYRENELLLSRQQANLSQAQYRFLARQVRPHFLFNTLHALSALIHHDIPNADFLISRLSDFLRRALDAGGPVVPLGRELEIVRIFVDIERIRFAGEFDAWVEADAECLDCGVPNMLIQPLVEVVMGQEGLPMRMECRVECWGERVAVMLCRHGVRPPRPEEVEPLLAETRQRLDPAYGGDYRLSLDPPAPDSLTLRLDLPKRGCGPDGT